MSTLSPRLCQQTQGCDTIYPSCDTPGHACISSSVSHLRYWVSQYTQSVPHQAMLWVSRVHTNWAEHPPQPSTSICKFCLPAKTWVAVQVWWNGIFWYIGSCLARFLGIQFNDPWICAKVKGMFLPAKWSHVWWRKDIFCKLSPEGCPTPTLFLKIMKNL